MECNVNERFKLDAVICVQTTPTVSTAVHVNESPYKITHSEREFSQHDSCVRFLGEFLRMLRDGGNAPAVLPAFSGRWVSAV